MARENYRVLTLDIANPPIANLFNGVTFVPGLNVNTQVAGIVWTIPTGVNIFVRHGTDGDLYQVFDGESWNHVTLNDKGCPEGETTGFCISTNAVAGVVSLRVTYGSRYAGPEASF